jgi:hypothetical protein
VSVDFTGGTPQPTAYQWYRNTIKDTNGATPVSGATNNTLVTSESAVGTYYYYCTMTNANCSGPSVETGFYTVNVAAISTAAKGTGTFNGRACFDIAYSNSGGSCGTLDGRKWKVDFSNTAETEHIYSFVPLGNVSNVQFVFENPPNVNAVISMTPQGNYNGPVSSGTRCDVKVRYSNLNTTLQGRTREQAIKPKLYAIYNDAANGSGTYKYVELIVNLQDCNCCGAKVSAGNWLNVMCHNLGADTNLDPFTWNNSKGNNNGADIKGDLFQWGRQADGHELRNSATTNTLSTTDKPDPKFILITNLSKGTDWRSPKNDNLWGNGTQSVNVPKGPNDPCPLGWKVLSSGQWAEMAANNTVTWVDFGYKLGDALYLPAAGNRSFEHGGILDVENLGAYWTSTVSGTFIETGFFTRTSSNIYPGPGRRAEGFSVRCVSE